MQEFLEDILPHGKPYSKCDALVDIVLHPEILTDKNCYNKLQKRWMWGSTKTVSRFIQLIEEKQIIVNDEPQMSLHGLGLGRERMKKFATVFAEPIKQELPPEIYRSFDHLSISKIDFDRLIAVGYSKEQVDSMLDSIENSKNNKKYNNLYITARDWLKRNYNSPKQQNLWDGYDQNDKAK